MGQMHIMQIQAFLVLAGDQSWKNFRKQPGRFLSQLLPEENLLETIRRFCPITLAIDGDEWVAFSHHTVREYLLAQTEFIALDCRNIDRIEESVTKWILQFLLIAPDLHKHIKSQPKAPNFLTWAGMFGMMGVIASLNWDSMVADRPKLNPIWSLISSLLEPKSLAYSLMLQMRWGASKYTKRTDQTTIHKSFQPIGLFLAENNVQNVLRRILRETKRASQEAVMTKVKALFRPHMRFLSGSTEKIKYHALLALQSKPQISNQQVIVPKIKASRRRFVVLNRFGRFKPLNLDGAINEVDEHGNTMLYYCCYNESLELVDQLLDHGALGSIRNNEGVTPFWRATAMDSQPIAAKLIERNQAVKETPSCDRLGSIQYWAYWGWEDIMGWALDSGEWSINDSNGLNYWPPLYIATNYNQPDMVKLLLARKANINQTTKISQETCLHSAARTGNENILNLLLEHESLKKTNPPNDEGITPAFLAAQNGNLAVFELICSRTPKELAMFPTKNYKNRPVHTAAITGNLEILKSKYVSEDDLLQTSAQDLSILDRACAFGQLNVVKFCFEGPIKFDVNLAHGPGNRIKPSRSIRYPPFITALSAAVDGGYVEIVEYLLENGATEPPEDVQENYNIILSAARSGSVDVLKLCRERFPHIVPKQTTTADRNILHIAACSGSTAMMKYVISEFKSSTNGDINAPDNSGFTPLHLAVQSKSVDLVRYLLEEEHANPIPKNNLGITCLMIASVNDDEDMMDLILKYNPDVDEQQNAKDTALSYAAAGGKVLAIKKLCNLNADLNHRNCVGLTPVAHAISRFQGPAVRELINSGANVLYNDDTGVPLLDRITETSSLWSTFGPLKYLTKLLPQIDEEKRYFASISVIKKIVRCLRQNPNGEPDSLIAGTIIVLLQIPKRSIGIEMQIKTLIEGALFTPNVDGSTASILDCSRCASEVWFGTGHLCMSCWQIRLLCNLCYQRRGRGVKITGCSKDHKFMTVGGKDWHDLEPGTINKEGVTFDSWLEEFKSEYLKMDVPEEELPSHKDPGIIDEFMEEVKEYVEEKLR
jgi:ankyrin repeat protein